MRFKQDAASNASIYAIAPRHSALTGYSTALSSAMSRAGVT